MIADQCQDTNAKDDSCANQLRGPLTSTKGIITAAQHPPTRVLAIPAPATGCCLTETGPENATKDITAGIALRIANSPTITLSHNNPHSQPVVATCKTPGTCGGFRYAIQIMKAMTTVMNSQRRLIAIAFTCHLALIATVYADESLPTSIEFNRDIRPILSNHCFQCHGKDKNSRAADLRLDDRRVAMQLKAIVPGNPEQSELIARVFADDHDLRMPPAEANKPLSAYQTKLLQQWITEGAEYQDHWAFQKVQLPAVPAQKRDSWCINDIDTFVLRKLNEAKLKPSSEAHRASLIRRLYQDLLGLLPTIAETKAFVNNKSPDAYDKLVDRLLASSHYGERWGRHWLDHARYADSHGFTIDGARIMWPYRDWVIAAINNDMPFDRFTIKQLAGDLLPDASPADFVATAFHRNTMINQEGGVKADQYRHEATIDRVNTTGAVWLGLTVGCAQCHSHKFDPFSHNDYYSLYAFFNGAADANNTGPTIKVHEGEMFGWNDTDYADAAELQKQMAVVKDLETKTNQQSRLGKLNWNWLQPQIVSAKTNNGQLTQLDDGSLIADSRLHPNDTYRIHFTLPSSANSKTGASQTTEIAAVRLRVLTDSRLPKNGPGLASNGNFVLTEVKLQIDDQPVSLTEAWADHSQPNYTVSSAIDGNAKTGWAINVGKGSAPQARMNAQHEAIFLLKSPVSGIQRSLTFVMEHGANSDYQVGRFAIDIAPTPDNFLNQNVSLNHRLATARKRVAQLQARLPGATSPVNLMVMKDMQNPPPTFRLDRGDFLTPDTNAGPLPPSIPGFLNATGHAVELNNRLGLARWLVSRDNPLTARVTVNRIWAKYFGRGLVETENDFGFQGTLPSHPDLLDWLAWRFMNDNWSMKAMHKLIVSSATYRQSSDCSTESLARDPGNHLLSRQSRFRVEAEIVRDQALAASGLLNNTLGGPSVHPPQPDGIYAFTQNAKSWPTETGPNRYRRTMYTMFYRSAPYPLLTTFDAPDFCTTCTTRVRSNTPLQSLTTANDQLFLEIAQGLAETILVTDNNSSDEESCREIFERLLTRPPTDQEISVLRAFLNRERKRFQASPPDAKAYTSNRAVPDGISTPELAAYTSVVRVLINTDEFVNRN